MAAADVDYYVGLVDYVAGVVVGVEAGVVVVVVDGRQLPLCAVGVVVDDGLAGVGAVVVVADVHQLDRATDVPDVGLVT